MSKSRLSWPPILERATEIVSTSALPMTLRQLFYRLVSEELIPNALYPYNRLSRLTAAARRRGEFPRLIDPTRQIEMPLSFTGPEDACEWLRENYRRPRSEGQRVNLIVGVEKATQFGLLRNAFEDLGLPVTALRGYSSQSHVEALTDLVEADPRPAVLIYAGDFDPSGEDISRDFIDRCGPGLARVHRVALDWSQVLEHDLPPQLGKTSDPRAAEFERKHGQLVQVELEALAPEALRGIYQQAIDGYWDAEISAAVLAREKRELMLL
jgi:hypothetical protein